MLLALADPPQGGESNPVFGLIFTYGAIFLIFYFLWWSPMRNKQKRLEALVKGLKPGDKVILNPGIFGTIVGVDDDALLVRVDDKTRIKVLKSAVAGLQGQSLDMEKK